MSKFLVGSKLKKAIASITANGQADMAVAFWGDGACEMLDLPLKPAFLRIACDARSGACNPAEIEKLLNRGARIVDVPGLHAKVYRGSDAVVIASANASSNGMGIGRREQDLGLEAGYVSTEGEDISAARRWFEDVFRVGFKVTKADLPELRALWRPGNSRSRPQRVYKSLLDRMLGDPDWFADRQIKVAFYEEADEVPKDAERRYKRTPFYDKATYQKIAEYPFYWETQEWKLQPGDFIIDMPLRENKPDCTGVWLIQDIIADGALAPAKKIVRPFGLSFPNRDQKTISRLSEAFIADHPKAWTIPVDAAEFARAIARLA